MDEYDRRMYERIKAATRAQLAEAPFTAAFAEGQMMTLDQAIAYALADTAYMTTEDNAYEP